MFKIRQLCLALVLSSGLYAENFTAEAEQFRRNLPPNLQSKQTEAIRQAQRHHYANINQVRNQRNTPSPLPPGVSARYVQKHLRLYTPMRRTAAPRALLIYLHGGCWCFGSINSCSRYCGEVARRGDVLVLAVNYRLAPEHPFPAALHDTRQAWQYAVKQARQWGSAPELIALGGDSAGGNLALTAALTSDKSALPLNALILHYPVTKVWADKSPAWRQYGQGYGLDTELMTVSNQAYAGAQFRQMAVSPACAPDAALKKLPPCLFIAADRDILRDQGREFATRLKKLQVPIEYHKLPGTTHLFITVPGQEQAFQRAVELTANFLQGRLLEHRKIGEAHVNQHH